MCINSSLAIWISRGRDFDSYPGWQIEIILQNVLVVTENANTLK